jgi:anaerobic magnesium-protoporphyrin IX monomethyl ester cyclase
MAKILFISDNLVNESLGIMYLSSYLKLHSHKVELTFLSEYKKVNNLLEYIEKTSPDLIGFSVMTPQVNIFRPVAKIIKETTGRTVIWGGPHCMFMPEDIIKKEYVDIICIGEGEEATLALMNQIDKHKGIGGIANLWIKRKDGWEKNNLSNLEYNLDKYPFPDRALYYDKYPLLRNFAVKRLITQRGCPYNCSYCFEHLFKEIYKGKGHLIRRHSVSYVIGEIKSIISKYPTKLIHFSDDTFNFNREWVMDFLNRYKKEIGLPFTCNISILGVDEEMIKGLKEAGCDGLSFGLEHGVENIRMNYLNKKVPNRNYVEIAKLLHKYKIKFMANVMFCLPNESLDDAVESLRFAQTLNPYTIRITILKIYKSTNLAKFVVDNKLDEMVGEFTYKAKDVHRDYEKIKNTVWAGNILIKSPLLLRFAKKILSLPIGRLFRPLMLLDHWQEAKFFHIPFIQSLQYFWQSRKIFVNGLGGEQTDVYEYVRDNPKI